MRWDMDGRRLDVMGCLRKVPFFCAAAQNGSARFLIERIGLELDTNATEDLDATIAEG
jgi:hypothetical protein